MLNTSRTLCAVGLTGALMAAAPVAQAAAPAAQAAPEGHYAVSANGGATFALLNSNNLFPSGADDAIVTLSTTSAGALRLPFPVRIYGVSKSSMVVSSNGNIQFFSAANTFTNDCLPTSILPGRMLAVFWDDLFMDAAAGQGVFTRTSGASPHRKFIVSWQARQFSSTGDQVRAQVVFTEGSQNIRMVYGANGGGSATVGLQAHNTGPATQWTCNSGTTNAVVSGLRLDFLHVS